MNQELSLQKHPRARRQKLTKRQRKEELEFYISILPWLIGFFLFTGGPILASMAISLTDWTGLTTLNWVGLQNYIQMFTTDKQFFTVLFNTFYYAFFSVTLGLIGSVLVAVLMNQKLPGINVFRTIYYLPSVTSGVAIAIMWVWLFNPSVGLINYLLSLVGIKGPMWLASSQTAMPALILMSLWGIGSNMIVLLAGLQGIPEQLYEAARIDGANKWDELVNVTLPMLSPVIFYVLIISVIGSFQIFENVFVMTRGGPGDSTRVFVFHLYQNAFEYQKMGYASALAWILFIIILLLTFLQFKFSQSWVYYEYEGAQ
jgi:multiple sugar transport system permease protein